MHTKTHNSLKEFTKTEGVLGYPSGVPNLFAYLGKRYKKGVSTLSAISIWYKKGVPS